MHQLKPGLPNINLRILISCFLFFFWYITLGAPQCLPYSFKFCYVTSLRFKYKFFYLISRDTISLLKMVSDKTRSNENVLLLSNVSIIICMLGWFLYFWITLSTGLLIFETWHNKSSLTLMFKLGAWKLLHIMYWDII